MWGSNPATSAKLKRNIKMIVYDEYKKLFTGERHLVDWQFGLGGDFNNALFDAISKADELNLAKLEMGFPEEVIAFRRYSREYGYWENIEKRIYGN